MQPVVTYRPITITDDFRRIPYEDFLKDKVSVEKQAGPAIDLSEINPICKKHQKMIVQWSIEGICRAIFASFGLGKTIMQLEIARLILESNDGMALIVAPLGVRQEFFEDAAKLGIPITFIKTTDEADEPGIYLTNYESVREAKVDPSIFTVLSLDEGSCLRSFGSKTFSEMLFGMAQNVPYRFVATATPSPNDYQELLAYAHFLGIMDIGQSRTRFFERNSEKSDDLTIMPHKEREFWMWVSSWALFVERPSDICDCKCHRKKNYKDNGSADSLSNHGQEITEEKEPGSVSVIAEKPKSQHQHTSQMESSSAADVSDQNTAAKAQEAIISGKPLLEDVQIPLTKIGKTTADAGLRSAKGGKNTRTSSKTLDSLPKKEQSNELIITETTNLQTAIGQPEPSRQGTQEDPLSSPTTAKHNHSPLGQKNSKLITGNSIADIKPDGQPKESSRTWCDECRCDVGYDLPEMKVFWHEVKTPAREITNRRNNQNLMFPDTSMGVSEASKEKRNGIPARIEKMKEIVDASPDNHFLLWHDLEDERYAIEKAIPGATTIYGKQKIEEKEKCIEDFKNGKLQYLAAKPVMAGSGCNFQRHCHDAIFVGIGFKFNDFIQAIYRIQRFLQEYQCNFHFIYSEGERDIKQNLVEKWERDKAMRIAMREIIREYGLSNAGKAEELQQEMGVVRKETKGKSFSLVHNDNVPEMRTRKSNSVGLIMTSIPFANQYRYSANYADFGHSDNNQHFFNQLDYLTSECYRVLEPGRVMVVHVKDRVTPGAMTRLGFQVIYPFHADVIAHYCGHGFAHIGMRTIVTDVVRENNQTYRMSWTQQCKDATKIGSGLPEYLLAFRKPQTDKSRGYADTPVKKDKKDYKLSKWQIDAHGFWRSSGNRLLAPEEWANMRWNQIFKKFKEYSANNVYDYEYHVEISEALSKANKLPKDFMLLQPASWNDQVWTDITRMRSLNGSQSNKGRVKHICPLPFDIVDRIIEMESMPGETVLDPFAGIGTVPLRAMQLGRIGEGIELSETYFNDAVSYCKSHEKQIHIPSLFEVLESHCEEDTLHPAIANDEELEPQIISEAA